jgi:NitT/TauT family transport system ATP-binding protein
VTQVANKQELSDKSTAIEIRNLGMIFQSDRGSTIHALEGINLSVQNGEFVTLLGATGCGKTTLLNIIAGLDAPDQGHIELNNSLKFGKNIAYVFQHYTLLPWRTTLGNVSFAMEMRGIPKRQRKLESMKLLSKVGLEGFENAYAHELSGGMRQRAAIAQSLAMKPKLLLMDEPFGAVDDSTRAELQNMITGLWQENQITIIFVTHNIDEAIILGSRVIVLSERPGKILSEFKVELPRPRNRLANEFTELFIKIRTLLSEQLD